MIGRRHVVDVISVSEGPGGLHTLCTVNEGPLGSVDVGFVAHAAGSLDVDGAVCGDVETLVF
jgi:hypothetical protein